MAKPPSKREEIEDSIRQKREQIRRVLERMAKRLPQLNESELENMGKLLLQSKELESRAKQLIRLKELEEKAVKEMSRRRALAAIMGTGLGVGLLGLFAAGSGGWIYSEVQRRKMIENDFSPPIGGSPNKRRPHRSTLSRMGDVVQEIPGMFKEFVVDSFKGR
ncbi:MAG: hypothetical protein V1746_08635 [bacterium]